MINLNGIKLKNRFLVSSGALGYGLGWPWEKPLIKLGIIDPTCFGGVSTKTLTLESEIRNFIDPFAPWPKMILNAPKVLQKVKNGWLNNLGLWNVGIDYFIEKIFPEIKNVNLIVSINGETIEAFLKLIEKLNPLEIAAIELNVSCPNAPTWFEVSMWDFSKLLHEARDLSKHPLIVKLGLSANFQKMAFIAGCKWAPLYNPKNLPPTSLIDAIHITNSIAAAKIIGEKMFSGGHSGPAIKPFALWAVHTLTQNPDIAVPIIGGGGITSWKDCQEFFLAGAKAVSFGSVFLEKPGEPTKIVRRHTQ